MKNLSAIIIGLISLFSLTLGLAADIVQLDCKSVFIAGPIFEPTQSLSGNESRDLDKVAGFALNLTARNGGHPIQKLRANYNALEQTLYIALWLNNDTTLEYSGTAHFGEPVKVLSRNTTQLKNDSGDDVTHVEVECLLKR